MESFIDFVAGTQAFAAEKAVERVDQIGDQILKSDGTLAYVLFFGLVFVTGALIVVALRHNSGNEKAAAKATSECAKALESKDAEIHALKQQLVVDVANARAEVIERYEAAMARHADIMDRCAETLVGYRQDFQRTYDTHAITNGLLAGHNIEDTRALEKIGAAILIFDKVIELKFRELFDDFHIVPRNSKGAQNDRT